MEKIFNVGLMFDRLKTLFNLRTDTQLAELFGMKLTTLSSWKNRNTFDINDLYKFCIEHSINMNWLLTGQGNSSTDNQNILATSENQVEYRTKINELENELKKNEAEIQKDNSEITRLQLEIAELRAKLEYADNIINKLIKAT